ncbi:MAG TPA: carboxypeptidase-like regulatory domain-containing protein, partial [Oscillatoriaceae cyanobacterium]
MIRHFPPAALLLVLLISACTAAAPNATSPSGHRLTTAGLKTPSPGPSTSASPTSRPDASGTTAPSAYFGLVLDTSGKPAVGVPVTGYLLSNNGGGLISDKGSSIISNNGSGYHVLDDSLTATTDAQGHFTLHDQQGRPLNLEAVANPDTKAIAMNVASDATGVTLQLAPTGTLTGTVTASDTAVTNLIGVDVFVPGTSYQAQTDSAGHFTISQMPQGTFQLYATKTGVGQALVSGAVVKSGQNTTAPPIVLVPSIPTIAGLSVHDGAPGSAVTITGTKFGSSEGKTFSVSIGGAQVTNPD